MIIPEARLSAAKRHILVSCFGLGVKFFFYKCKFFGKENKISNLEMKNCRVLVACDKKALIGYGDDLFNTLVAGIAVHIDFG